MDTTAVIFSPLYYRHNPGSGHPESPRRLRAIVSELEASRLRGIEDWRFIKPERARLEDVRLVHDMEYIKLVKTVCKSGGGLLDLGDTVVSPESFEVAFQAVGGTLKAIRLVMEEKFQNAFALVRPPGHHAGKFSACGFCIFNNISIAAEYLLEKYKIKRVLILDIDAHHGNGTQEIFYDRDEVLYVSLHQDPRGFPGTGFINEIGKDAGRGYNVNIPLPFRIGDKVYLKAIHEIVEPIIREYKPQFILVSAGLDGHYTDPVASLYLSNSSYQEVYKLVTNLASKICEGKLVSVLEGGYSLDFVGKITTAAIATMSRKSYVIDDEPRAIRERTRERGEKIVKEVKKTQRGFWGIG